MFAILVHPDNVEKIELYLSTCTNMHFYPEIALENKFEWYFIRGYVTVDGKVIEWAALPEYMFRDDFEHDPVKIQTDWDQIVRK